VDQERVGKVQTVRGLIDPGQLGVTLMHEHLLIDMQCYFQPPREAARAALAESRDLYRGLGDRVGLTATAVALGDLARIAGDHAAAGPLHAEALAQYRAQGERGGVAAQLHNLAYVALAGGEVARARALLGESLALQRELDNPAGIAEALGGLAALAVAGGEAERAARLLGAATTLWGGHGLAMWPAERAEYERTTGRVRAQLDEGAYQQAWDAGRALTTEQAIACALEEPPDG
jgi:hypothetical protein